MVSKGIFASGNALFGFKVPLLGTQHTSVGYIDE